MEYRVGHHTDACIEVTQDSINLHFSYYTGDRKATLVRKLRGKDFGELETAFFCKSYWLTRIIFLLTLGHAHLSTLLKSHVLKILYPFFQGNIVTLFVGIRLRFTRQSTQGCR